MKVALRTLKTLFKRNADLMFILLMQCSNWVRITSGNCWLDLDGNKRKWYSENRTETQKEYIVQYKKFNGTVGQDDEEDLMVIKVIDEKAPELDISNNSDYKKRVKCGGRCRVYV